jgi:hypothetical protein
MKRILLIILFITILLTACETEADRAEAERIRTETQLQAEEKRAAEARAQQKYEDHREANRLAYTVCLVGLAVVGVLMLSAFALIAIYRAWHASQAVEVYALQKADLFSRLVPYDKKTGTLPALVDGSTIALLDIGAVVDREQPQAPYVELGSSNGLVRAFSVLAGNAAQIAKDTQDAQAADSLASIAAGVPMIQVESAGEKLTRMIQPD